MRDDIDQARRAGYSDDQIAQVLAQSNPEIEAALKGGYSGAQVLTVLQQSKGEASRQAMKDQSWSDYGADLIKGVVYGAGQEAKAVGTTLAKPADRAGPASTVNSAGSGLQAAGGAAVRMAGDYQPAQFDILHPIDTASQLPKAAAEAAPGILATMGAGAAAGAAGGALAGPAGALVGGLGGAALYGFMRYWGGNARALAAENGRSAPTQADFDQTLTASIAQSGVDAATLKAAGVLGRTAGGSAGVGRALMGPQAAKNVADAGLKAAQTAGIMGAGGTVNSAIGQAATTGEVDLHEAANAGATGAVIGGMLGGVRVPAEVVQARRFGAPNAATGEAVGRLVDHMRSDAFPGNPGDGAQTAMNLKLITGLADDRLNRVGKVFDEEIKAGTPDAARRAEQKAVLDQYGKFLRQGVVLDEGQINRLGGLFEDVPQVAEALVDRSAANWIAEKASAKPAKTGFTNSLPFKLGAGAGAASHILPALSAGSLAGLSATGVGGTALATALAAKALSKGVGKITGFSDINANPMGTIAGRYGSGEARPLPTVMDALQSAPRNAPQAAPEAPPAPPAPSAPPMPPRPPMAAPEAPKATPEHPSLADALGQPPAPRFAPRPGPAPDAPVPAPEAPAPAPAQSGGMMAIPDILTEMRAQAQAENQPLLDVAHLHHRSARAIADTKHLPEAIRTAAGQQASDIWHGIIKPMEAQSAPDQVKRARSSHQVHEGPAPESFPRTMGEIVPEAPAPTLSPAGAATMRDQAPAFFQAVEAAQSEGAVARAANGFLANFSGQDRAIVQAEITKTIGGARTRKVARIKAEAEAGAKLKRSRTGRIKTPRAPRKPKP